MKPKITQVIEELHKEIITNESKLNEIEELYKKAGDIQYKIFETIRDIKILYGILFKNFCNTKTKIQIKTLEDTVGDYKISFSKDGLYYTTSYGKRPLNISKKYINCCRYCEAQDFLEMLKAIKSEEILKHIKQKNKQEIIKDFAENIELLSLYKNFNKKIDQEVTVYYCLKNIFKKDKLANINFKINELNGYLELEVKLLLEDKEKEAETAHIRIEGADLEDKINIIQIYDVLKPAFLEYLQYLQEILNKNNFVINDLKTKFSKQLIIENL